MANWSVDQQTKGIPALSEFGKPAIYAQLLGYARPRIQRRWVAQKYKTVFGVWPRGMDPIHTEPMSGPLKSWLIYEQIKYAKSKERMKTIEAAVGHCTESDTLGVDPVFLDGKHHPCILCGGKDRFRFDNKDGSGSYFCSQCGAGTGMQLLMAFREPPSISTTSLIYANKVCYKS